MILSSQTIRERVLEKTLVIEPFSERSKQNGLSYGLSCHGYDVRLAKGMWVWPIIMRLGVIMEYLDIPTDLMARVCDKSTNVRLGIVVQNTVIEAGWRGYLTVELTRHWFLPIFLPKGYPIAQIIFEQLDKPTDIPYTGKYQNQPKRPIPARFEP